MKQSIKYIVLAGFLTILAGCANSNTAKNMEIFQFDQKEFDFGVIKQSGGIVSHEFTFSYNGDSPIAITSTPASCVCTSGKISSGNLKHGDQGVLTVEFDPNLHEEPEGRFFKTVAILTEPKLTEIPEVKIWVEIDLDLGPEAYKLDTHDDGDDHEDEEDHADGQDFHSLKPSELKAMLADKDFFLLDVHIPEQEHIPGTDAFVDYSKLADNIDKLPSDKDGKIVVYCRSGSMSKAASVDLIKLGYTNVYDLEGGINAFNAL